MCAPAPFDSTRGDVNGDGKINATDVQYLKNYLTSNGPAPAKKVSRAISGNSAEIKRVTKSLLNNATGVAAEDTTAPFRLSARSVEITAEDIRIEVVWESTSQQPAVIRVFPRTFITTEWGDQLRIAACEGLTSLATPHPIEPGSSLTAILIFPLPWDDRKITNLNLYLFDQPEHYFLVKGILV